MSPSSASASFATRFIAVLTVAMTALAAGAMWSALAFWLGRDLPFFALIVGALMGAMVRAQGLGGGRRGSVLAASVTLIAAVYAGYLIATADVAMLLGLPVRDALSRIGPEMALSVAWARTQSIDLGFLFVGIAFAAFVAGNRRATPTKA